MTLRTRALLRGAVCATLCASAAAGLTSGPLSAASADPQRTDPAALARADAAALDPLAITISVDGFNQDAIAKLPAAQTNWLRMLRKTGTSTTNARSAYEQTNTLPNHASILTGRRIDGPTGHHIDYNYEKAGTWIAKENSGRYVPSMFDVAHDHGLSTALYTSKEKFKLFDRSYDAVHGAADITGVDNGRDKIDDFVLASPTELTDHLVASLTSSGRRDLYFWHIALPDQVGHDHGFMSKPYLRAIATTNAQLGKMFAALNADADLKAATSIILTADHGGRGPSHRDATKLVNYRVPFYTWGRGVAVGPRLYAKNPTRLYPGTSRPRYAGRQPIRNMDAANTTLRLLGLPALAGATPAVATR